VDGALDRARRWAPVWRVAAFVLAVAWLLSSTLQSVLPWELPAALLALAELELFLGARRERRAAAPPPPPPEPDADEDDEGPELEDWEVDPTTPEWTDAWELPYDRPVRRPWRRAIGTLLSLGLVAAVLAVAIHADEKATWSHVPQREQAQLQQRFSREAARIAGHAVSIRCDERYAFTGLRSDVAGIAFASERVAFLSPDVCLSLKRVADGSTRNDEDAAFAITVLAHEATPLAGTRPEGVTECLAVQRGVALGPRLGLSRADASRLMRLQLDRDLTDSSLLRLAYRLPAECHDGGSLDLRPADSSFP